MKKNFEKLNVLAGSLSVLGVVNLLTSQVQAVAPCVACVVAIGGGLGVSRALGIDDGMTGVWVGALLLGLSMFTDGWIKKKWPAFKWSALISYGSIYLLTIPFFFIFDLFSAGGEIYGISKLLLGMIVGTVFLILSLYLDKGLRGLKDDGKAFFPFQKVILPVVFLIVATVAMWWVTS